MRLLDDERWLLGRAMKEKNPIKKRELVLQAREIMIERAKYLVIYEDIGIKKMARELLDEKL